MKTFLLILFFAVQATAPPDRKWDGQAHGEGQLPPGHYCQNHALSEKQQKQVPRLANECHCDYNCVSDEDSQYWPYYPSSDCLAFCHKANVQCTCHPEEPCPHPSDKDHTVSPVGLTNEQWLDLMSQKHDELKHGGLPFAVVK